MKTSGASPAAQRKQYIDTLAGHVDLESNEALEIASATYDATQGRYLGFRRAATPDADTLKNIAAEVVQGNRDCWIGQAIRRCRAGHPVGQCPCPHPMDKQHVAALLSAYCDMDVGKGGHSTFDDALEAVLSAPIEPTLIVASGGGVQAIWVYDEPCPDASRGEAINRAVCARLGGDPAATDACRVLRLPGTRNRKYGPEGAPVELLANTGHRYSIEDLEKAFPPIAKARRKTGRSRSAGAHAANDGPQRPPETLRRILGARWRAVLDAAGAHDYDSASEAEMAIVGAMVRAGFSDAEIWTLLLASPRWDDRVERKGEERARALYDLEIEKAREGGGVSMSDTYPLTDMGNARRLVDRHGDDLRYCGAWRCWLVWDGTRWIRDETGEVVRRAKDTITALHAEALGGVTDEQHE